MQVTLYVVSCINFHNTINVIDEDNEKDALIKVISKNKDIVKDSVLKIGVNNLINEHTNVLKNITTKDSLISTRKLLKSLKIVKQGSTLPTLKKIDKSKTSMRHNQNWNK